LINEAFRRSLKGLAETSNQTSEITTTVQCIPHARIEYCAVLQWNLKLYSREHLWIGIFIRISSEQDHTRERTTFFIRLILESLLNIIKRIAFALRLSFNVNSPKMLFRIMEAHRLQPNVAKSFAVISLELC
jgi:hypothetical protein